MVHWHDLDLELLRFFDNHSYFSEGWLPAWAILPGELTTDLLVTEYLTSLFTQPKLNVVIMYIQPRQPFLDAYPAQLPWSWSQTTNTHLSGCSDYIPPILSIEYNKGESNVTVWPQSKSNQSAVQFLFYPATKMPVALFCG
ncbi:hypothetical protein TEQG_04516 [Trichophyton equinum CBS 127.97]|uniref:Uncharacterized protein n=1 Tax=Trichophyton equinum (strain ATCC MYA-4606 / CBS 127.97) TaxID=559882 RepID=F2PUD9_TRIEC|nr:hypothetical protein TEQG_04516 [Trichophyton equinum CBS 127.97]